MKAKLLSTLFIGGMLLNMQAHALTTVTASNDGVAMANSLIGSGITIVPGSVNYIGATVSPTPLSTQGGFFSGGTSTIGIDTGVILTSGVVTNALGPNSFVDRTTELVSAGDADLDALISQTTNDANILEFDFTTAGGDLFFRYVFASEEYNEFVGSRFNDVFAFFVDGINIAIAPNGQPVSINNVNCGFDGITATGPNCSSFNNNERDTNGNLPDDVGYAGFTEFDIEYDGFTDVFTASFLGLGAGTHTIKLAIADTGDSALDSAVFIEAGSFTDSNPNTPNPTVPEPGSIALIGLGFVTLGFRSRQKKKLLC